MPEWLKGTDCKSVGYAFCGSNPHLFTIIECLMKKEELVKTLVETQVKTASEGRNADLDQTTISQVVVRVKNLRRKTPKPQVEKLILLVGFS